ncbi:uncharacterized protein LOC111113260 isoform X3 [Crassostrea virginica]
MGDLKKIAYRIVGISIFLMQLFSQIGLVNIYTSHCKASLKTLQRVSKCPTNITTYEEAVKQKNCSALSVEAGSCVSFQYHCVLNEDLQFLVEICAPAIIITGHVCAKFSTKFQSIMSADGMSCEDDNNTCPFNYNSTDAYKYKQCHTKVSRETSSPTIPCSRREESTRKEAEMFVIWFRLLLYLPLLCFTTSIVIFLPEEITDFADHTRAIFREGMDGDFYSDFRSNDIFQLEELPRSELKLYAELHHMKHHQTESPLSLCNSLLRVIDYEGKLDSILDIRLFRRTTITR